jgi:penicillin amidase
VWRSLLRLGFDDEFAADLAADGGGRWFEVVTRLLERPRDAWWDNRATPGLVESRDEILRQAMVAARIDLTRRLGKDPSRWQWGRLHKLELRHPVLGSDSAPRPVRAMVNRGPWWLGGGAGAVDATRWNAAEGFAVTGGAGDADGRRPRRPRPLAVGQPDRRVRAPLRRALRRPDRRLGRRTHLPLAVQSGRRRGGR